ncbi:hypothetical protein WDU94_008282 [Cyamophila willieti]
MALLTNSITIVLFALLSLILFIFYLRSIFISFKYWKQLKVPYLEPSFPFGNVYEALTFRRPTHLVYQDMYLDIKFGLNLPYAGIYTMTTPVLVLTDPELIKHVLIKDFDVFVDRGLFDTDESTEPMMKNLFGLRGDEWRKMRNKMSPTFTSGRIKEMFPLIEGCGQNLVRILTKQFKENKHLTIDVKDYLVRYMTDVIGSTVFGIEINAVENPDCEFRQVSKVVVTPSLRAQIFMAMTLLVPKLKKWINFNFMDKKSTQFFFDLVRHNVNYREEHNIKRNDFIHILMQLKKNDADITEEIMVAQCFVFFIAGFDTSSSVLSFCLYELSNNKTIQNNLRQEITDTKAKNGGELSYESYQEMPLLDKVVKEALRMYAPLAQLDRKTTKPYTLPGTDITLETGTKVFIPLYGLHHDPEIYPNPDVFDPERFAPENVDSIPHYAYMPFGEGPRNCIGKRFGQIQLKSGLALLVSNFQWDPDHSNILRYQTGEVGLKLVKPLKLKVTPINL